MEITIKNNNGVMFDELDVGDVFVYDGAAYVKVENNIGLTLGSCSIPYFSKDTEVYVPKKIEIEF